MKTFRVFFFGFVFLFFLTAGSFLGWYSSQSVFALEQTEELRAGTVFLQKIDAPEGSRLVPRGCALHASDVEEVVYTYRLKIDEGVLPSISTQVLLSRPDGTEVPEGMHLVETAVTVLPLNQAWAEITVVVSLIEPADATEYSMIAGNQISLLISVL